MENSQDLERVQRAAVRIIMGKNFDNYEVALQKINLQKLEDRRNDLSLKFEKSAHKMKEIFPIKQWK